VRVFNPDWTEVYSDVDITQGAMWIKDYGGYADILEVTDLDSACGAVGRVLVTEGSVGLYGRGTRSNAARLCNALESCGMGVRAHREIENREARRADAWRAMRAYGYGDTEREIVLQVEAMDNNEMAESDAHWGLGDSWRPHCVVDGEAGLRAWLHERYDVDM
jgi:hypothetical protein